MQAGLGPGQIVLDGGPTPSSKGAQFPIFGAYLLCQMARWIKISLSRKVGLDPSDIVLDGDRAPLPKKGSGALPHFRLTSFAAKNWIEDVT